MNHESKQPLTSVLKHGMLLGWKGWSIAITLGWIIILMTDFITNRLINNGSISTPIFIELIDNVVHAMLAFLITLPFFLAQSPVSKNFLFISVPLTLSIDIDHLIAAGFNLQSFWSLPIRTLTHSLMFAILLGGIVSYLFYMTSKNKAWKTILYIIAISMASHVLRDAANPLTRWMFPFKSIPLPTIIGFFLFIVLSYLHLYFCYSRWSKFYTLNITKASSSVFRETTDIITNKLIQKFDKSDAKRF